MQVAFLPPTSAAPIPGAGTPAAPQPEPGADSASFAALLDSNTGQTVGEDVGPSPMRRNRAAPADDKPAEGADSETFDFSVMGCPPMPVAADTPAVYATGATEDGNVTMDEPPVASAPEWGPIADAEGHEEANTGRVVEKTGRGRIPVATSVPPEPPSAPRSVQASATADTADVATPEHASTSAVAAAHAPAAETMARTKPAESADSVGAKVAGVVSAEVRAATVAGSAASEAGTRTIAQVLFAASQPSAQGGSTIENGSAAGQASRSPFGLDAVAVSETDVPNGANVTDQPAQFGGLERAGRLGVARPAQTGAFAPPEAAPIPDGTGPTVATQMPEDPRSTASAGPVMATRTLAQVLCEVPRPVARSGFGKADGGAAGRVAPNQVATEAPTLSPAGGAVDATTSQLSSEVTATVRGGAAPLEPVEIAPSARSSADASSGVATELLASAKVATRASTSAGGVGAKTDAASVAQPVVDARAQEGAETEGAASGASGEGLSVSGRTRRENPAALRARATTDLRASARSGDQRNFQSVVRQGVGEAAGRLGTDTANGTQPMPANATDLPPSLHVLAADEPVVATVGTVAEVSPAGSTRVAAESGPLRSVAAETIRQLQEVAERARDTGRNQMEFQVRTPDDENLRVNLRWNDGVVHARFVTESTELQQALSREWALAAPRLAEKGLKFDQPSFEHHERPDHQSSSQDGFSFAQQRHSSRGQERSFESAGASGRSSTAPLAAARPSTSLNSGTQFPDRTAPLPRPATGVTNLRAWA